MSQDSKADVKEEETSQLTRKQRETLLRFRETYDNVKLLDLSNEAADYLKDIDPAFKLVYDFQKIPDEMDYDDIESYASPRGKRKRGYSETIEFLKKKRSDDSDDSDEDETLLNHSHDHLKRVLKDYVPSIDWETNSLHKTLTANYKLLYSSGVKHVKNNGFEIKNDKHRFHILARNMDRGERYCLGLYRMKRDQDHLGYYSRRQMDKIPSVAEYKVMADTKGVTLYPKNYLLNTVTS